MNKPETTPPPNSTTSATAPSWTHNLKNDLARDKPHAFDEAHLTRSVYRPFTKQWLYYSRSFNERVYQMPRVFPIGGRGEGNRAICVSGLGHVGGFSALMVDAPSELCVAAMKGGSQCFPRWIYDPLSDVPADGLALDDGAAGDGSRLRRRDAITDTGLARFQATYPGEAITKDDLFHYTYGLLHSPDYRAQYADTLTKQLPRLPTVTRAEDFRAFVRAGQELANLHCGYEDAEPHPVTVAQGDLRLAHIPDPIRFYRVEKMRFGGKRPNLDRTTLLYNQNITITGIPLEAYEYVVNGKPALVWVMERQGVSTDTSSGITSDANAYAVETAGDPAYPYLLFCRVITVSLRTMEIARALPPLDITPTDGSGPGEAEAAVGEVFGVAAD